ncbi:MAG: hypothetical protein IJZ82_02940 [Lachnospiraceae bacterium]|nr:hypothetical protein [Lachnospiraceae bacterium]
MYDLRPFIGEVERIVERHYLGEPGKYTRWITQDEKGSRDLGSTPYGCANAVNILYTIGALPSAMEERAAFVKVLQDFQNPEDGLFMNPGNYETHTTAFVSGALNLLDAKPLYTAKGFAKYQSKEGLWAFMDSIDWAKNPWLGAHLGAGIYASMLLTDTVADDWEDLYFQWLDENADPATGLWKKGALEGAEAFHYLASTFHYVFNYEYAKRALPYPKELLDTCIKAYREGVCMDFSKSVGWPDIDFTYLLARVQRRAGSRFEETQEILKEIADGLITQLLAMNPEESETLNDLNTLFAIVCTLAVLQDALPGYIRTSKPLKLVLDKRPFL